MDRHSFSEPRPVPDADIPTWHVDVFRQGVPDPIFTLVINNATLPPRKRKNKIVWKLPTTIDEKPNFGYDEKKRMLQLFKQEKKTRKKQLKKSTSSSVYSDSIQQQEQQQQQEEETNGRHSPEFYLVSDGHEQEETSRSTSANGCEQDSHMQEAPSADGTNGHVSIPLSPSTPPIPPPGFAQMSLHEQPPQEEAQPPTNNNQATTNDSSSLHQHHDNHDCYFVVSTLSSTIPVDLAKVFVDVYYPTLCQAPSELVHYYCRHATKSLSVGGAHAVCSCLEDILLQLSSLQQSSFLVKGVVAQPGIQESVVLLITGMVASREVAALPFCHSLTLVSSGTNGQFQIHNDAMAFLTE